LRIDISFDGRYRGKFIIIFQKYFENEIPFRESSLSVEKYMEPFGLNRNRKNKGEERKKGDEKKE